MKTKSLQFGKAMSAALFVLLLSVSGKKNAFLKAVKAGPFKQLFLFAIMLLAFAATTEAGPVNMRLSHEKGILSVNSNTNMQTTANDLRHVTTYSTSHFNMGCNEDGNGDYFYDTIRVDPWGNVITPAIYQIGVLADRNEGIAHGGGNYEYGESCMVSAEPNMDYIFTHWTENGVGVSTSAVYTFTVTCDRTLRAHFRAKIPYTITATANPSVAGTVSGAGTHLEGQTCILRAIPSEGFVFTNWTENGNVVSTNALFAFEVTENRTLVANFSEGFVIGSENSQLINNGPTIPYNYLPSYTRTKYSLSEQIYTAAELGDAGSITSIAFYNEGDTVTRWYDIYLKNTGKSSFSDTTDWVPVEITERVFSGDVTMQANDWTVINFEIPFGYDGHNVILVVNDRTEMGNSMSPMISCRVFNTDESQALFRYSNNPGIDPWYPNNNPNGSSHLVSMKNQLLVTKTVTNGCLPSHTYSNYSLSEQIYTADELGGAGYITSVAFYNDGTEKTRTYDIYLKSTLKDRFYSYSDWESVSSDDLVFSGDVTMQADNWTYIAFNTPFAYDGNTNVVLVMDDNTGSYTTAPNMSCRVFNTDETQAIYIYSNDTNYNPCSPDFTFTGARLSKKNQLFVTKVPFSASTFNVSVSANPPDGGTVAGAGTYTQGQTCTVTATANENEGYEFVNWTENGNVVSTDANYSFTVTEARSLVANFAPALVNYYTVIASANPTEGGIINGTGTYQEGETCTLVATAHTDYSFTNWTKDGEIVSTESVYSFTVTEDATYVANFEEIQVVYYNISANSNPSTGGSVTGAGTYMSGQTCTLTAIANEDHAFVNWTENGNVVSTDANYSFTVTGNRTLVANFTLQGSLTNHWTPIGGTQYNMTISGIILIDGVEQTVTTLEVGAFCGDECRGSMTAEFFLPTQQYVVSLTVVSNQQSGETITFRLYDQLEGQELDLQCANSIIFESNAIIGGVGNWYQFDFSDEVVITATVNPEGAGSVTGAGSYMPGTTATLAATANSGYAFREWTVNGETVSTDNPYSFTVTGATNLVAQFDLQQISNLPTGWSWRSTYIEMNGNNGLQQLEQSLGHSGLMIKTQSPYVQNYYPSLGYDYWFGPLTNVGLTNEAGYQISVSNACQAVVSGAVADAAAHPVTIAPGWNWIGYPVMTQQSLSTALANFTPAANDLIKGQNSSATYYDNYGWFPTSFTLTPGQGYMYLSNATENKTLTYAVGRCDSEIVKSEERVWTNDEHAFADNLTVIAVVSIDGEEQQNNELELGAFVDGECRGSAVLEHFELTDRWYAVMTVAGVEGEEINFAIVNRRKGKTNAGSANRVVFVENAVVGSLDEPYEVNFTANGALKLYPNPVERNEAYMLDIPSEEEVVEVFVFSALGEMVSHMEGAQASQRMQGMAVAGVYTVKAVCRSGNTYIERLIVK